MTVAQETGKVARKGCAALSGGGSHQDRVHRGLRASIREIIDLFDRTLALDNEIKGFNDMFTIEVAQAQQLAAADRGSASKGAG